MRVASFVLGFVLAGQSALYAQETSIHPAAAQAAEAQPPVPAALPTDREPDNVEHSHEGVATPAPISLEMLPAKTPVVVALEQDLTTVTNQVGDMFKVVVAEDVVWQGTTFIPKGTVGSGQITFVTKKGGFGKPGIIGIALRDLDFGGTKFALDGRYREEGKNNNGATAATFFAAGIFAGVIQGKAGVIPRGRELHARTGEPIPFVARPSSADALAPIDADHPGQPATPGLGADQSKLN
ncbi:MAG: hypothetical protein P0Y56_07355 [Candidatus Andeanibacterium colombiense]|uniref:Uncharacterized protein n=1 Tax=Candidatus Andeanibacterium colombiense TaxID=3121345 RepID=A0AAJ5X7Z6_9SPHN|nr:MAG: hypothetical protein P0Y56_07355 [Sphingomonadaceae bacterium]